MLHVCFPRSFILTCDFSVFVFSQLAHSLLLCETIFGGSFQEGDVESGQSKADGDGPDDDDDVFDSSLAPGETEDNHNPLLSSLDITFLTQTTFMGYHTRDGASAQRSAARALTSVNPLCGNRSLTAPKLSSRDVTVPAQELISVLIERTCDKGSGVRAKALSHLASLVNYCHSNNDYTRFGASHNPESGLSLLSRQFYLIFTSAAVRIASKAPEGVHGVRSDSHHVPAHTPSSSTQTLESGGLDAVSLLTPVKERRHASHSGMGDQDVSVSQNENASSSSSSQINSSRYPISSLKGILTPLPGRDLTAFSHSRRSSYDPTQLDESTMSDTALNGSFIIEIAGPSPFHPTSQGVQAMLALLRHRCADSKVRSLLDSLVLFIIISP